MYYDQYYLSVIVNDEKNVCPLSKTNEWWLKKKCDSRIVLWSFIHISTVICNLRDINQVLNRLRKWGSLTP